MSVENNQEKLASRGKWTAPTLSAVGTVASVLRGGGGKITVMTEDTGDTPRQPKGLVK